MLCKQCKVELRETGLGLLNCPKCHALYQVIKRENSLTMLYERFNKIGESMLASLRSMQKKD